LNSGNMREREYLQILRQGKVINQIKRLSDGK